jgi:Ca-activated chloride channel family protein
MKQLRIELIPLRPAVRSDAPTTLGVLVKITVPESHEPVQRPALNLGLVLDRSGSMSGQRKITFAREAAIFAVQELLSTDRVSLTIFDDSVQTLVPNTPAADKAPIVELIRAIRPGGSTALHAGWQEGSQQVGRELIRGGLNRVLLLSDGLANVGETNADVIATDVHRLAERGVSTSTLGLGDDFNEDLLEAMAKSGDGNYHYIESPAELPGIFQKEFEMLTTLIGNAVSLGIRPWQGVVASDVLNDLDWNQDGEFKLPNLVAGLPIRIVVRLDLPPLAQGRELCRFHLKWNDFRGTQRQELNADLTLPGVSGAVWDTLAPAVEVQEQVALLLIARLKREATDCLDWGHVDEARRQLDEAKQILAAAPRTPEVEQEAKALAEIQEHIDSGAWRKFKKHAKHQSYTRQSGRTYP